jgi:hypothetical protein
MTCTIVFMLLSEVGPPEMLAVVGEVGVEVTVRLLGASDERNDVIDEGFK